MHENLSFINSGIYSKGILELLYGEYSNNIRNFSVSVLLCFFVYIAITNIGFFITTLYYRMNKVQKITVSIGVPVLLTIILPLADTWLLNGAIFNSFAGIAKVAFINPFMCMLPCFVLFGLISVLNWLLVRKAEVKN